MKFESGEHIILNEGKCGWHKTLALTNQRLVLLNNDTIEEEIPLANIAEAYANTEGFINVTKLKIKTALCEICETEISETSVI